MTIPRAVYNRQENHRIYCKEVQEFYDGFDLQERFDYERDLKIDELFNPSKEDHYYEYGTD